MSYTEVSKINMAVNIGRKRRVGSQEVELGHAGLGTGFLCWLLWAKVEYCFLPRVELWRGGIYCHVCQLWNLERGRRS